MNKEELLNNEKTTILSCSFGKDSLASLLLCHENNIRVDRVLYCEIDFDRRTSAELPVHTEWIHKTAIPAIEKLGYKVDIVKSHKTYCDWFLKRLSEKARPERQGKIYGFPIPGRCVINAKLKIEPIKKYLQQFSNVTQIIGIAIDEPKRLKRLHETENKISVLEMFEYTEEMAKELCEKYNLLSPLYNYRNRTGCWFCPNMTLEDGINLSRNNPELLCKLRILSEQKNKVCEKFNRKETFDEFYKRILEKRIEYKNKK